MHALQVCLICANITSSLPASRAHSHKSSCCAPLMNLVRSLQVYREWIEGEAHMFSCSLKDCPFQRRSSVSVLHLPLFPPPPGTTTTLLLLACSHPWVEREADKKSSAADSRVEGKIIVISAAWVTNVEDLDGAWTPRGGRGGAIVRNRIFSGGRAESRPAKMFH